MDNNPPNIRVLDDNGKPIAYEHVGLGDSLKIMHRATRGEKWLEYSPHNLLIWLNGQPLKTLQKLTLIIDANMVPKVTITLALDEIDIDADSLIALEAIVKTKEDKNNG